MAKGKKANRSIKHLQGSWRVSELSIHYKAAVMEERMLTSTDEVYELIRRLWCEESICLQEQFMALFFNGANKLIGYKVISIGTMKSCPIDMKLLASLALHTMACYVVVIHNHPSGSLQPSTQDKVMTQKIKEALALIEVKLLDHFIVTQDGYVSFAEEGWV